MADFTPGPWQRAPNFPNGMTAIIDSDGRTKPYTLIAKAETDADASLIAAAPKMHHALTLALEYWAHRQQRYKNRSPVWVVEAREALSLALGEKQGE